MQLNVQFSLSRNRIDLLRKANEAIEGNGNFKFAYADMHGNLKFVLNKPLNRSTSSTSGAKKTLILYLPTVRNMDSSQPLGKAR